MQHFQNILFVSHGIRDEMEGLKQTLSLARNNQAALHVLIVCPELPGSHQEYQKSYEDFLKERMTKAIQAIQVMLQIDDTELSISVELDCGSVPAVRIIRHVLRNAHDLVIKEAEPRVDGKGFEALDMALLRKCPCPVWLCRPIKHSRNNIQVAVAIDPENEEQVGRDLAIRLLQVSRTLADRCSGELTIISCWIYQLEEYLRDRIYIKISDKELNKIVSETKVEHLLALETLIKEANIGGSYKIQHVKGQPEHVMQKIITDHQIDILVMGTVARTGIPGFIIGNTAESVVQQLSCSLLALKPIGFVSPVRAY
ncbi:universal stress protein [Legionella sp. km535]|uniref:universal stress protein n=1 Tax=Legionella sp. km535 TaxID=2498107 RepID=UPI000F8E3AC3|nr:universal stress protein [Legionella sp. km535]RUR15318.1 universal stress protein [Legionella sp. km535]